MLSALGLFISLAIWLGAIQSIVWSWNKHALIVASAGLEVGIDDRHISSANVIRLHTIGWTLGLFVFFLVMALTSFPLWQCLGLAIILSVIYGVSRIKQGEEHWIGKDDPGRVALFGQTIDRIWYRALAIGEWAGYLCSIVFASQLVAYPFVG